MKTLHLTNSWHERSGGIATFYRHMMQAADRRRHSMVLVIPGERDEIQQFSTCCRIYTVAAPASPLNREYRTMYPRDFLLQGSKIQQILTEERPDLVEICDKYSLVYLGPLLRLGLCRRLGFRPIVVGVTCERMDDNFAAYVSRSWWGKTFARFYMRHIYFPACDHHIAVSEHTAAELRDVSTGHNVPRGVWIRPMGVDAEHFQPTKRNPETRRNLLERCGNPYDATLLLYVGRLAPEKNLELLIATMVELEKTGPNFRLVLVGDGIAREALERAAQGWIPGRALFIGHTGHREELAQIYASCDVFVHPNPAEPFGIAPLEAMASGLALVAPDRGGVTFYANDTNSYLVPPIPIAFAQAILRARANGQERATKVGAARETAKAFAWPKITESFFHLYDELYDIASGRRSLDSAAPVFISSLPRKSHARCLSFAAGLAKGIFATYAQAHQTGNAFGFHQASVGPELESARHQ